MDVNALIQEINRYFDGDLRLEISHGRLGITVGARTLFVSLPTVVGAMATGGATRNAEVGSLRDGRPV